MSDEDLLQHAEAWARAAKSFMDYEARWSGSSLQAEAAAHRRLCQAVAQGYLQQIKAEPDYE